MNPGQIPDMGKIMKMAQDVAAKIEQPEALKSGKPLSADEMSSVIGEITKSVSEVVTPDMITGLGGGSSKKEGKKPIKPITESKITFDEPPKKKDKKKRLVEIESDSDDSEPDPTVRKTKDMTFTLGVTLEELYNGTKKKMAIKRIKVDTDGSQEEEKKKLSIKIEPGMIDEQTIVFNKMADEKMGYQAGDVIVSLDVEDHPVFIRDGNNLLIEKEISFYESLNPEFYITHLNGKIVKIRGQPFDVFSDEDDTMKKIPGLGMPILGEPGNYGDLFIRFKCVSKGKISSKHLEVLREIFPPMEKVPDLTEKEVMEEKFEDVTESDLDFFDSDSETDDSSDYSDSDDSDSD